MFGDDEGKKRAFLRDGGMIEGERGEEKRREGVNRRWGMEGQGC